MTSVGQDQGMSLTLGAPPLFTPVQHVVARLEDFFGSLTPWQRRLWDAGLVLGLGELREAVEWADAKVLSPSSVKWFASDLERLAGQDRGVGEREIRLQLQQVLRAPLRGGDARHRALGELTSLIAENYLSRWAAAAATGSPSPERFARAIGAHLLDAGYSPSYLHAWIRRLRPSTLVEIAEAAQELDAAPPEMYELLVPFVSVPDLNGNRDMNANWLSPKSTRRWLVDHGITTPERYNGGFAYQVQARDPFAAADLAREIVDRMGARASYSRKAASHVSSGHLWVGGHPTSIPLKRAPRGAFVLSLVTEQRLFAVAERSVLDNALELAAPLNEASPAPAISGGWSAVEALLLSPEDEGDGGRGIIAADRMAALVTCSWPRADLTAISYRHEPTTPDRLTAQLQGEKVNRERARAVAAWISGGNTLLVRDPGDQAAVERMTKLIADPRRTLGDIKRHMTTVMRRVYRHRNLVMHGGAVSVATLPMALRTAAPLLGAGLDRITHASLTDNLHPIDLSVRANISLELVGRPDGRELVDLIE